MKRNLSDISRKILVDTKYMPYQARDQRLYNYSSKMALFVEDREPGAAVKFTKRARLEVAVIQAYLREKGYNPGIIDGYFGPQTDYALEQWLDAMPNFLDFTPVKPVWPKEVDVPSFYGDRGVNQRLVSCPYRLVLAWNQDAEVTRISLHEKVADSAAIAMENVLNTYGAAKIKAFGLDQFGGSLNVRLKRGSAKQWSMHSWGIAIDWYPQRNQLKWGRDRAVFAKPEYNDFFDIWGEQGWVSLGRERNYDWMHIQAARLN